MADPERFPSWVRYSGAGVELAGAVVGLALFGYWIDGKYGTRPWGTLVGVFMGLVGGLYNLVKESQKAFREGEAEDEAARDARNEAKKDRR